MLDRLESSDFLPCLNQHFAVRLQGLDSIELELVEVSDLGLPGGPAMRRPFSLVFLGPQSDLYLRQHTYPLEHPQMGVMDLFIVPLGPQQGRMRYQAIFA